MQTLAFSMASHHCGLNATAWIVDRLKAAPSGAPLHPDVSIAALLAAVDHHRVAAALSLDGGEGLPEATSKALAEFRRRRVVRLLTLAAELAAAVRALTAAGIPVVAFKGPAVGVLLHGGAARRDAVDLDLLIAPAAWEAALETLAGLGYRPLDPALAADRALRGGHALALLRRGAAASIELHDRLTPEDSPFPLSVLRPFERPAIITIGGVAIPTLSAEAATVFAAHHGWKHLWARLHWLNDIAVAARGDAVDWPAADDLARRLGCRRHLALALALAAEILDAPPPENYADAALASAAVRRAKRATAPLILASPPVTDRQAAYRLGLARVVALDLALLSGNRLRLAALRRRLKPTEEDRRFMPLPAFLRPLHYAVRLVRLSIRYLSFRRH